MFIREIKKKNPRSDKVFVSHRLVESVRTAQGPRQSVLMNLGKLDLPAEQWKELANRIEEIVHGQQKLIIERSDEVEGLAQHYAKLLIKKQLAEQAACPGEEESRDFQRIDVNGLVSCENKSVGPEYVGVEAMKGLGFFELFENLGFTEAQTHLATLLIVGRLVHPSSERELKRYAKEDSGLDELLGTSFSSIGQNSLYRSADLLFEHQVIIEQHLRIHSNEVFSLKESIILYDLTNTYFTGQAPGYKRGRSKERRSDRPLVTLGLILDEHGFVKGSRIFEGNVSEPATFVKMVSLLHRQSKAGKPPLLISKPTVVLDAGIATKENLEMLQEDGFSYIVVSRSKPALSSEEDFIEIKDGVKARSITQGQELYLECVSEGRMKKEKAMVAQARQRMEQELNKVGAGLKKKGCVKSYAKVLERIGRIRERYRRVSKGFSITVTEHEGKAKEVSWQFDESTLGKPYDGRYYLRTNRTDLSPEQLWSTYVMLTFVEDAFRCLKNELGLRPIHHSKKGRIEGHLFISVLAYHLLNYVRYHLQKAGMYHRWVTIRRWLRTHEVLTTSMPKEKGQMLHVRHCTTATLQQEQIYKALGIPLVPLQRKKHET